jgi:valyl-tRNA synthetase
VRYWAGSARLGVDTAFDENVLRVGKRLTTKLWNAGKFVLTQSGPAGAISTELDRAFAAELAALAARATQDFERYEHADVLKAVESFFWTRFTDTTLELVKARARGEDAAGRASALATQRLGLDVLLRLFAPFLPYVTEEIWSGLAGERPALHPPRAQAGRFSAAARAGRRRGPTSRSLPRRSTGQPTEVSMARGRGAHARGGPDAGTPAPWRRRVAAARVHALLLPMPG